MNPNSSIDPPTALLQQAGDVYTLNDDTKYSLVILKDNVTINRSNHKTAGIDLTSYGRKNVTILYIKSDIVAGRLYNSVIYGCTGSIQLDKSFNNNIVGNNITDNKNFGIMLDYSYNNTIYGNYIANNTHSGILLVNSNYNSIYRNTIANNMNGGVYLSDSIDNTIITNNFINNTRTNKGGHIDGHGSTPNIWDDGTTGNYWNDFVNGSAYTIMLSTGLPTLNTTLDYDNHPQSQPFTIPTYPTPHLQFVLTTSATP